MTALPPAQAFSTVLLDELVRLGVRHVVVCPGSRSAPLAYAALAHERAGLLRVHVRTDERAAAFLALGIGKATGVPAAVVTTSGTAVANLHPAVLEAHEAGVPMLLLTCDRPHELRWTRANQTTKQVGIFGESVRLALDLEAPADGSDRMPFWRTSADRAVAAATGAFGAVAGPVHLNLALREPLTPRWSTQTYEATEADLPETMQGRPDGGPWTDARSLDAGDAPLRWVTTGVEPFEEVPRTLIVLGDAPEYARRAAFHFAIARGHVVIAEPFGSVHEPPAPTSRCRLPLPHGMLLAETPFAFDDEHAPDRVIVVGRLTLSRAIGDLLRRSGASCEVVTTEPTWPDPSHIMERVRHWTALLADCPNPGHVVGFGTRTEGALGLPPDSCGDTWPSQEACRFASVWERAAARLADVVERHVPPMWPGGLEVARTVLDALPEEARLFLGSSSVVRDASYVRARDGAEVVANRGLAGIDGCVSTASGMALAEPGRPTYALVGDLTFLHDSGALTLGPDEQEPDLTVIVLNDDGGAIFDTLEYGSDEAKGRDPEAFRRLFATPTGTSLRALAEAHGVDYVRAESPEDLAQAVRRLPSGRWLVEVVVPVQRARVNRAALIEAASQALG